MVQVEGLKPFSCNLRYPKSPYLIRHKGVYTYNLGYHAFF